MYPARTIVVLVAAASLLAAAAAHGEGCDLATCTCAGVSLAHLKDKIYTAQDPADPADRNSPYTIAVKICSPFTAAELAALKPSCNDTEVLSESTTVVRYSETDPTCETIGAVQPCDFVNGHCGMNATKTVPAPDFAPNVYSLDVRYEYSTTEECVLSFKLDMTMAESLAAAERAELGPVETIEGELCDERKAPLAALLPPAAGGGGGDDDDDDDDDGNCTMPADRGPNPPTEAECAILWDECDTDGLVNYLSIYYCELGYARYHLETWRMIAMVFILLWLFVLFMMLGSTADDFFSPALIVLSTKMNLTQRTAGVTLLALGNGAPDLFSVINTIYRDKPQVGLALGDLTGGGNFVVTVVLSALLVVVGPVGLKVEGMFLRDALFYAGSVMFVYFIMLDGEVTLLSSLLFFGGYVGYCFVVIVVGPRTPPCLSGRRDEWKLSRGYSNASASSIGGGGLGAPLMADGDGSINQAGEGDDSGDGETAGGGAGLTPAEGQALLSGVLGETVDRLSMANVADPLATATVLREEAERVQGMWMQLTGWEEKSTAEKIIYMLEAPFTVLRWLSIPPVLYNTDEMEGGGEGGANDEEEEEAEEEEGEDVWAHALERPLTAIALPGFTSFFLFYIFQGQGDMWPTAIGKEKCDAAPNLPEAEASAAATACPEWIDDDADKCESESQCVYTPAGMSVWLLVTLVSFVVLPPIVWKCTNSTTRPPPWFKLLLLFLAFMSSMFWMDMVAGEAVAVLTTLGLMSNINMAVLGLTVLAWGNSIGDLVADVSVARAGSPDMAVTACFAGPLFNMMVGLGVAFFIQCVSTGKAVMISMSEDTWHSLHVSFIGLSGILCATCLAGVAKRFRLHYWWVFGLGGYYCVYMIVEAIIAYREHQS
jgi:Ca2+/Na+ antiporter